MELLAAALKLIHVLSVTTLVGGLGGWVVAERWARREGWRGLATVDRGMVATGLLLSIALGFVIFSGLGLYYLRNGQFTWAIAASPWGAGQTVKGMFFLVFWVHWGWTEVVTLNDVRRKTPASDADSPPEGFEAAHHKAWRALRLLFAEAAALLSLSALLPTLG